MCGSVIRNSKYYGISVTLPVRRHLMPPFTMRKGCLAVAKKMKMVVAKNYPAWPARAPPIVLKLPKDRFRMTSAHSRVSLKRIRAGVQVGGKTLKIRLILSRLNGVDTIGPLETCFMSRTFQLANSRLCESRCRGGPRRPLPCSDATRTSPLLHSHSIELLCATRAEVFTGDPTLWTGGLEFAL